MEEDRDRESLLYLNLVLLLLLRLVGDSCLLRCCLRVGLLPERVLEGLGHVLRHQHVLVARRANMAVDEGSLLRVVVDSDWRWRRRKVMRWARAQYGANR